MGAIEDSWLSSVACPIRHPAPPRTFSTEAGREALITVEADQGPKSSPVLFAFRFSPRSHLKRHCGCETS